MSIPSIQDLLDEDAGKTVNALSVVRLSGRIVVYTETGDPNFDFQVPATVGQCRAAVLELISHSGGFMLSSAARK